MRDRELKMTGGPERVFLGHPQLPDFVAQNQGWLRAGDLGHPPRRTALASHSIRKSNLSNEPTNPSVPRKADDACREGTGSSRHRCRDCRDGETAFPTKACMRGCNARFD